MIEFSISSTLGKAYIFDRSDTCIGTLYANLTTLKEKESVKNAADDELVIENYIFDTNETDMLKNEHTVFIPRWIDESTGKMEGTIYIIKELYYNEDGNNNVIGAECQSGLLELLDELIMELDISDALPSEALSAVLDGSRFVVDYADNTGLTALYGKVNFHAERTNKLHCLVEMIQGYGGEFSCRALYDPTTGRLERRINWYVQRGWSRGKLMLLEKDMTGINVTINTSDIITRVYGYGKKKEDGTHITFSDITGREYIEAQSGSARYAWCIQNPDGSYRHREYVYVDDQIEDPQILLDKCDRILANCGDPRISVTANLAALQDYATGFYEGHATIELGKFAPEPWHIGDTVHIYTENLRKFYEDMGIRQSPSGGIEARILEYTLDHINPENTEIKIESVCVGYVEDMEKEIQREIQNIREEISNIDIGGGGGLPVHGGWFEPWVGLED